MKEPCVSLPLSPLLRLPIFTLKPILPEFGIEINMFGNKAQTTVVFPQVPQHSPKKKEAKITLVLFTVFCVSRIANYRLWISKISFASSLEPPILFTGRFSTVVVY
jgi:hypothetical protein